jgi:hypothetical protein
MDPEEGDPVADDRLERAVMGEEAVFTAEQIADTTGITLDQARRLPSTIRTPPPSGH